MTKTRLMLRLRLRLMLMLRLRLTWPCKHAPFILLGLAVLLPLPLDTNRPPHTVRPSGSFCPMALMFAATASGWGRITADRSSWDYSLGVLALLTIGPIIYTH
jgi:hypothetical protein